MTLPSTATRGLLQCVAQREKPCQLASTACRVTSELSLAQGWEWQIDIGGGGMWWDATFYLHRTVWDDSWQKGPHTHSRCVRMSVYTLHVHYKTGLWRDDSKCFEMSIWKDARWFMPTMINK